MTRQRVIITYYLPLATFAFTMIICSNKALFLELITATLSIAATSLRHKFEAYLLHVPTTNGFLNI